jgi:hypothetical protein
MGTATQTGTPGRPQATAQQTGAHVINDAVGTLARAFERSFGRRVVFVRSEGHDAAIKSIYTG